MKACLLCFIAISLCTCLRGQSSDSTWTQNDAARYAREQRDSTTWNMDRFAEDLALNQDTAYQKYLFAAIRPLPSPVPDYDWGYVNMQITKLAIAGKEVLGVTYAYAYDRYRPAPDGDTLAYYRPYFNIFILTDTVGDATRAFTVSSRNAPHYLGTGTQLTSVGPVEFAQMSLAGGENFAIVSQRYFDLRFGRTLLVAPQTDGSLRFLQLEDAPDSLRAGRESDAWNTRVFEEFQRRLEGDKRVVNFFTRPGTL